MISKNWKENMAVFLSTITFSCVCNWVSSFPIWVMERSVISDEKGGLLQNFELLQKYAPFSPFLFIHILLAQLIPVHSVPGSLMGPGNYLEARSTGWISCPVLEFLKCPFPGILFRLVIFFHWTPLDNWQSSDTLLSHLLHCFRTLSLVSML